MTAKPLARPASAALPQVKEFPDFPPRDDMQNPLVLYEPGWQPGLRRHLGPRETTLVISETPLSRRHGQRDNFLIPDLMIAFNIDREAVIRQRGYAIEEWGRPPDFALEIASPSTFRNDLGRKFRLYAEYEVPELWLFDREEGRYYLTRLSGYRMFGRRYHPIRIHQYAEGMYWGHSEALNLDLCWEHGELRWYDPVARQYLLSYDDAQDARIAAENARAASDNARLVAENARRAAEARIRELEEENRRLRGE